MDFVESNQVTRGRGKNKRKWSAEDDGILIESLQKVSVDPRWKNKSGWKNGYLLRVEELVHEKLPRCELKLDLHINSRWKTLKSKYHVVAEILSSSGFGWDQEAKTITCNRDVYDEYCKCHREARGLLNAPFPLYDATKKMEKVTANEAIDINSGDEDGDDNHSVTQPTPNESASNNSKRQKTLKRKQPKEAQVAQPVNMASDFHHLSTNFGEFMQDMRTQFGVLTNTLSLAEEREQEIVKKSNAALNELLQIEGLTDVEALKAADILTAKVHRLRVFYLADINLRRKYVYSLLYPSCAASSFMKF